jgi:hypothetical protein
LLSPQNDLGVIIDNQTPYLSHPFTLLACPPLPPDRRRAHSD